MRASLADTLEDLNADWFTRALRDAGVLPADAAVTAARPELFGTGQFGLVARAELEYDERPPSAPESVIVKLPSQDPGSRAFGIAIGAYEAEVRFYQEVAPRSSIEVPAAHWTSFEPGTGRVTLVLDDLSADWSPGDSVAGGTVAQAEAAIDQIARLHADLWDEAGLRELEWLAPLQRTQMLFDGVPTALPVFRERFGERLEPHQLAAVEKLAPKGDLFPARAWKGPLVVAHGDFRLDNVLFREEGDGLRATIIDWQSLRLAPPLIDLAIWLGSCLPTEERRTHQDALLQRYHERLLEGGVRHWSLADCAESLRTSSLYVFLLGIGISVTIQQSERGDEMFAGMVRQAADFVTDLGAEGFLDEEDA